MNKKLITAVAAAALSLAISTSAFASTGTVDRTVNFRSAPSTSSSVYGMLKAGTQFQVLEQVNSYWLKVSANGRVGYVSTKYVSVNNSSSAPASGTGTVVKGVNFRTAPSTNSGVIRLLKAGTTFQLLERVNSYWLKISVNGQVGYVSTNYVSVGSGSAPSAPASSAPSSAIADQVIQNAMNLRGVTRYKLNANQPPTLLDCSSFTKYVFGQAGISLKWGTRYQKDAGRHVDKSNLQKGDLVFFGTQTKGTINHVGIYIGDGQFIHNSPSFDGVGISNLNSGYWADKYITARRVL
jgi:cell wall-associated NlpC family hydrolase